jgi:hypothetical protein
MLPPTEEGNMTWLDYEVERSERNRWIYGNEREDENAAEHCPRCFSAEYACTCGLCHSPLASWR